MARAILAGAACLLIASAGAKGQVSSGSPASAPAGGWQQWMGPSRNGVTAEKSGFPANWPPRKAWSAQVGKGCTSPIIAQDKVYVMGYSKANNPQGGTDTVCCLDAASGREVWKQTYPSPYQSRHHTGDEGQYGGPLSTPALDTAAHRLYTLSVDGQLRCWNASLDGKLIWSKSLIEEFKVAQRPDVGKGKRDYGFTSSPLLYQDWVIVEVGSPQGTVMAFDKATGAVAWKSALTEPAGHTSGPVIATVGGKPVLLTLTLKNLAAMRLDKDNEGKTLCEFKWQTDFACNIPAPAVDGSRVFVTSGYNHSASAMVDISGSARQLWASKASAVVGSPVIYRGRAYVPDANLQCVDLADGSTKWRGGSFGHGSCLITGDDKILVLGNGKLALVDATPADGKYKELGAVDKVVPGTCYPHVALADGVIMCKDKDGNMVALSVR